MVPCPLFLFAPSSGNHRESKPLSFPSLFPVSPLEGSCRLIERLLLVQFDSYLSRTKHPSFLLFLSPLSYSYRLPMVSISSLLPILFLPLLQAFAPTHTSQHVSRIQSRATRYIPLNMIDSKRRKQLGIADDEDEYDLGVALSANTDAGKNAWSYFIFWVIFIWI